MHRGGGSCFSFLGVCCPLGGFVPAWRLRARTFGSSRMVPAHVGVAWGTPAAATYGGLVAVACLIGGKMMRFCSSLAHALGLSRQASESLLLSQKGVWRVRRPVSGASKEILISGGLPSQTWLVCWGSKRPHPSAKHETCWKQAGGLPPPTCSPCGAPNLGGRTDRLTNRSHRASPNCWPPCSL